MSRSAISVRIAGVVVLLFISLFGPLAHAQRLSPQGGTITGATAGGGLVVTNSKLGLSPCVTVGHALVWNGTTWACAAAGGGGSSFSTLNVIPKGNGTGLASSLLTDDTSMLCYDGCAFEVDASTGKTWTGDLRSLAAEVNSLISNGTGSFNGAVDIGGNLTVGGGPTKFTVQGTTGNITTLGNSIFGNSDSDTTSIFGVASIFGLTGTTLTGAYSLRLYDTTATAANVGAAISFGYDAGGGAGYLSPAVIKAIKENGTATNRDTALVFATATEAGGGNPTERMRIRSDGGMTFNGTTGADGYVLTVDAATHIPKWAAAGGGITNSAGNNVLTKSNGTNLVASLWTDDGTTAAYNTNKFTIASASGNTAIAGTLGVTGAATLTSTLDARGAVSNSTGDVQVSDNLVVTGTTDQRTSVANSTGTFTIADAASITGTLNIDGNISDSNSDVTVADGFIVTGTSDLQSAISNSTGTLNLSDSSISLGSGTSAVIAFTNGPSGINLYEGKHLDYTDEWLQASFVNGQAVGSIWNHDAIGTGAGVTAATGISGRPGVIQASTGTTTTGWTRIYASPQDVDFDEGTWTFEETFQVVTLSTSTEEYLLRLGFADNTGGTADFDGCHVDYDRANTLGALNAGNADKWELRDDTGAVHQGVLLDGTSQNGTGGAGAITTVDTPVTAGSWIRWKLVATTNSCAAYADTGSGYTLRATLTGNVPTAATGPVAIRVAKTAGTTARTFLIDQTRVAADLTNVRSP